MVRPRPPQREPGDTWGGLTPEAPRLRARQRERHDGRDYDRISGHRVTATLDIDAADYVEGLTGDLWIEATTDPRGETGWERVVTSRGWVGGKKSSRRPDEDLMPSVSHWRSGSRDAEGEEYRRYRAGYSLNRRARVDVTIAREEVSELVDAHHSVAYENGGKDSGLNTTSVDVVSFTTVGTDRVAYCRAAWNDTFINTLSSFTYGGTTLGTEIGSQGGDSGRMEHVLHRRMAPATAASSIVATLGGAQDSLAVFVTAYSGVDQTTPNRAPEGQEGTAVDIDDTITTDTDELIESMLQCFEGAATADGTSRLTETRSADWHWHLQTVAPASGSQNVGFTANASSPYTMLSVSIQPSVAAPTGTGAIDYPIVSLSGAGAQTHTASGAITYAIADVAGVGNMPPSATGAIAVPIALVSGAGTHGSAQTGTGGISYPMVGVVGLGAQSHQGAGAIAYPLAMVVGAGAQRQSGQGATSYPVVVVVGAGTQTQAGAGAISYPLVAIVGAGEVPAAGEGAIGYPIVGVAGVGVVPEPDSLFYTLPVVLDGARSLAVALDGARSLAVTVDGARTLPVEVDSP